MIYTVTLNPCLDYLVAVPGFQSGRVNRARYERIIPGGKGINVSYVLNILRQDSLALGLVGGFTGQEIERLMDRDGIRHDFVHLQNDSSRIDDIIRYAKSMQDMGARNVLVSLDAEGAVLITESGEIYRHSAMEGTVRNTVGCGDSMLAGFLTGYFRGKNVAEAFQLSLAAASANAFHEGRGTYDEIMELLRTLQREIDD